MVRSMFSFLAKLSSESMSLESISMFLVFSSLSVPALPGATKIDFTCFDCESFQVNACSLPPLPTTRTLYSLFMLA